MDLNYQLDTLRSHKRDGIETYSQSHAHSTNSSSLVPCDTSNNYSDDAEASQQIKVPAAETPLLNHIFLVTNPAQINAKKRARLHAHEQREVQGVMLS